ncbi:MAG: SGNH/GDSL hydrolase family protein, partial [Byssovorax sp.]
FGLLQDAITKGDEAERMQPVRRDPASIGLSQNEDPLKALRSRPLPPAGRRQVVFFGNSQQYTASLPRGATIAPDHFVEIASELFESKLEARAPGGFAVYNAAVANQNFIETLWQGLYWFKVADVKPSAVVIQASFDTFRKTGVRPGFQALLEDPGFTAALDAWSAPGEKERPYVAEMAKAREEYADRKKELAVATKPQAWTLEGSLRKGLDHVPLYRRREEYKNNMLVCLYLARVLVFKISPTTRRHITGTPLLDNFTALTDLVRLAKSSGASVFIYNAPVNPRVSMFFQEEYDAYLVRLRALAEAESAGFADVANLVPGDEWGYWVDGPDPIHFDEQGHQTLAGSLDASFGAALAGQR